MLLKEEKIGIKPVEPIWSVKGTGTKIVDLLTAVQIKVAEIQMDRLGLFFVNQLLNKEGDKMLTWKQLKYLRGKTRAGKKAKWYQALEEKILQEASSREVRSEYALLEGNLYAMIRKKDILLQDR